MPEVTAFLIATAGVVGLVIGSVLNVVADRVPARVSLSRERRCPNCDAPVQLRERVPVVSWLALRGMCASCGARVPGRYAAVEVFTGIAFAGVTWMILYGATPSGSAEVWALVVVAVAFLYFAAISIVLTLIDLDSHRLPNGIVLPSYLVAGMLFTLSAGLSGDWASWQRAAIGLAVLYAFYFLLRLARPGGMGGGDVKLAGVIGIYLGWTGWGALAIGALAAFFYGGVFGIALLLVKRVRLKTAIPFGPWMILGAWTGVLAGEVAGSWYIGLLAGV